MPSGPGAYFMFMYLDFWDSGQVNSVYLWCLQMGSNFVFAVSVCMLSSGWESGKPETSKVVSVASLGPYTEMLGNQNPKPQKAMQRGTPDTLRQRICRPGPSFSSESPLSPSIVGLRRQSPTRAWFEIVQAGFLYALVKSSWASKSMQHHIHEGL